MMRFLRFKMGKRGYHKMNSIEQIEFQITRSSTKKVVNLSILKIIEIIRNIEVV